MSSNFRTLVASFAALLSLATAASAAQELTWTLTTADLRTESVVVRSVQPAGLKVAPAATGGAERDVPLDQFVELSRPVAPAARTGKFDLILVGGEKLNGEPAAMKDESLVWKNPVVGEVTVPLRLLAALVKADGRAPTDRRKEDEVTLSNGDVVRGTVLDLTPQQITLKNEAGDTPIPFGSMVSVVFAATAPAPGAKEKPSFRVRLDEGSSIAASAVRIEGGKLEATVGGAAKPIDLARVSLIEQVNGPVSFLSNRPPTVNVYTPYLGSDQRFVARMNSDFDGNPIRFRERVYARSVATHSYSRVTWPLDGTYVAFRTRYAMDPKAVGGDVTVRIKLDDKVVHEQANVRPGILSSAIVLDVGQAKTLTLEVDYGRLMDSNDRLNWLEPALLRVKPAAEQPLATEPVK